MRTANNRTSDQAAWSAVYADHDEILGLLDDYLGVCNRAMQENDDDFWYSQVQRLNEVVLGDVYFRTVVYGEDSDDVLAEATIHFDPEARQLTLLDGGSYHTTFTWMMPLSYLRDVVVVRPDWYVENPMMLDMNWVAERLRKGASPKIIVTVAGLLAGLVTVLVLIRRRR